MATKDITAVQVCLCVAKMHRLRVQPGLGFQKTTELLSGMTGKSKKECQAAINREIKRGLVEAGIHFSIGWLTYEEIDLVRREGFSEAGP